MPSSDKWVSPSLSAKRQLRVVPLVTQICWIYVVGDARLSKSEDGRSLAQRFRLEICGHQLRFWPKQVDRLVDNFQLASLQTLRSLDVSFATRV
jgi:hypothetical protein